jgi:hypothetical protein
MFDWLSNFIAFFVQQPSNLVMIACLMVLAKLLLIKEKQLEQLVERIGVSNTLLAQLMTLVNILVTRKEREK